MPANDAPGSPPSDPPPNPMPRPVARTRPALTGHSLEHRPVRTLLAFLPAALVLGIGGLTVWRLDALRESQRWVNHTHAVLATNDRLIRRLVDLETGYRGYVLTGDTDFLAPYHGSAADARAAVARLAELTSDNPTQRRQVVALGAAVEGKIAWGEQIMRALETRGRRDAAALVATMRGKVLMDEVRREADAVGTVERRLLVERSARAERQGRLVLLLVVLGALAAGVAAALTNLLFARTARREARSARALERQNRQLEEQAVELETQREQLQDQASELEMQAEELQATSDELLHQTEELRRSEERLLSTIEAAGVATWSWDLATDRVVYQRGVDRLFGLPGPDITGRQVLAAIHPDDRATVEAAIARCVATGEDYDAEFRLAAPGGRPRWLAGRGKVVREPGPGGGPVHVAGVNFDITDRKRIEEQLRQAQKLQALGTLAGGVAHEINNQLAAVVGFTEFARKALTPDHPAAADLREVHNAANRAVQVAQQILTFGRRQVTQPRVLDLVEAAADLAPVLRRLLGADRSLTFRHADPRHLVRADPTQVDQVLINLVANARDATGPGDNVTIATEEVTLGPAYARGHGGVQLTPGRYVQVSVADTGRGMDKATLAHVFEPFFTTKAVGQGTGLGLSTVYGIVKQHGGFVWAYSEPGLGTTMKVYLPAAPAEAAEQPSRVSGARHTAGRAAGAAVLVAEDEPLVRSLARRTLEAAGFRVTEAEDGRRALELLAARSASPDLLVTDVIMPGLNGRELASAVAERYPEVRVLFMSGYTGDDILLRGLIPEGAPFIQKPFSPERLVERVRALLEADDAGD